MSYIMVDVEADGPSPGDNAPLSRWHTRKVRLDAIAS